MKVIVCGAGRVGKQIAQRLAEEGDTLTVIDTEQLLVDEVTRTINAEGVVGHASHPSVLEQAGARAADMVIAATRDDEVNMMICQVAYSHFDVTHKIARIRSRDYLKERWRMMFRQEHMPVDDLICPEHDVADAIVRWLGAPATLASVPFLEEKVRLVVLRPNEDCPALDTPLSQLSDLFEGLHAIVVGLRRGAAMQIATGDLEMKFGDDVYVIAPTSEITRTLQLFGFDVEPVRRVVVIGGGAIGVRIVEETKKALPNVRLRLVELNEKKAHDVLNMNILPPGEVIMGDALEPEILNDARVGKADAVVAVTNDEQVNVLAVAFAKQLGAKWGLALAHPKHLRDSADKLGVDVCVDPEIATLSSVVQHVHRGFVKGVYASPDGKTDIFDLDVQAKSRVVNKTVRTIPLKDFRIGAAMGADGTLKEVSGGMHLEDGDRVVLFVGKDARRKVEHLFQLEFGYFS